MHTNLQFVVMRIVRCLNLVNQASYHSSAIIDVISTATINNVMSTTGVTAKEVDVELHDCFSTNELITYEALVSHPAVS